MKTVVVTGVSTGIGHATAKVLVEAGYRVFGSVRKVADAERLTAELGGNFAPLIFDITDEAAVRTAAGQVRAALGGGTLFGLVNNAGVAVPGPMLDLSVDEFRRQIETNLMGQLIVTQAFAPLLGVDAALKGEPGRIVMISSVSGKRALPFMGLYSASKHALEGLSTSLRRELMLFGIDVIVIGPGAIKTPIWDKAEAIDLAPYGNSPYFPAMQKVRDFLLNAGHSGLTAERVGKLVLHALTARKPKVRYAIVTSKFEAFMGAIIPPRMLDRLLAKRLGLQKRTS